jgi:hypothetical protein
VAIAIAPSLDASLNVAFWSEIAKVAWIDRKRSYVVNPATQQPSNPATSQPGNPATVIKADPTLPPNRYTRHGNTLSAPPAVVQSFAAALIPDDLKETPPPNGRR